MLYLYSPKAICMKKFYPTILTLLLCCFLSFQDAHSQSINNSDQTIEGLSIYPNPTTSNKIYINSTRALTKQVEIYNVLGKRILFKVITSKELDISTLKSGVYIIKIKEKDQTATRKLVVH